MLITQNGNSECYRKTHLGEKESKHFTAGDELKVFTLTSGMKIGFLLCIESHIPQISETLARKGAHIIFSPHAVPKGSGSRATIWKKYIPARAYDYRVYLACCNQTGNNGIQEYEGACFACNPRGEIILESYSEDSTVNIFSVDLAEYESYRQPNNRMGKRYFQSLKRPFLYI